MNWTLIAFSKEALRTKPYWLLHFSIRNEMMVFHIIIFFNSLVLFFYFSSLFFANCLFLLFNLASSNSYKDNDDESEYEEAGTELYPDESFDKEEDLVADVLGGETLMFLRSISIRTDPVLVEEECYHVEHQKVDVSTMHEQNFESPVFTSESEDSNEEKEDQFNLPHVQTKPADELPYHEMLPDEATAKVVDDILPHRDEKLADGGSCLDSNKNCITGGLDPKTQVKEDGSEEIMAGSFTGGSTTSDSSRDWRSSMNFRDSETEDPFSSSSRRSSSRWENYTVYKKYDEEMMFLDRVSAQKLAETESLRSIVVNPRSVSQRIFKKITTMSKQLPKNVTPYQELEAAYVAQVCLAWEALHWNYNNTRRIKALGTHEKDPGCPAHVAQQFQQFQVLLQRFIEMEPFESGRRPEVYARIRRSSPKLLQVPEFQGDEGKEDAESKVSTDKLLVIMEDAIRTFMSFLKADKESLCRIIRAHFKKYHGSIDSTLVKLQKRAVKRREMQLKEFKRSEKCFRKRKLKDEEIMEILMGLIDLKVVTRVLRTSNIKEEQLHWCEDKISKVRVWDGKLQRDSSILFFPAH